MDPRVVVQPIKFMHAYTSWQSPSWRRLSRIGSGFCFPSSSNLTLCRAFWPLWSSEQLHCLDRSGSGSRGRPSEDGAREGPGMEAQEEGGMAGQTESNEDVNLKRIDPWVRCSKNNWQYMWSSRLQSELPCKAIDQPSSGNHMIALTWNFAPRLLPAWIGIGTHHTGCSTQA